MEKIKHLSRDQLDDAAYSFLYEYSPSALESPQIVDLENLIENKLKIDIDYKKLDLDGNILGMTVFKSGNIEVFNNDIKQVIRVDENTMIFNEDLAENLKQQGRFRFTLAHEIGHWFLHRHYFFVDENQLNLFDEIDNDNFIKCLKRDECDMLVYSNKTDEDWLEWQADNFASSLIMPKEIFTKEYLMLKNNGLNNMEIVNRLSQIFGVSKQACEIRINILFNKDLLKGQVSFQF